MNEHQMEEAQVGSDGGHELIEEHEEILDEHQVDDKMNRNVRRAAASQSQRAWQALVPTGKRGYQHHEDEDDMVDEEYLEQAPEPMYRRAPEGPRKRGRPRKYPAGNIPADYVARLQQKEPDYPEPQPPQHGARILANSGPTRANILSRGGGMQHRGTPRLTGGPIHGRLPVGQASQIAAQRLPSLSGAPPRDNKPLKVVTLMPNSRRIIHPGGRPVIMAGTPNRSGNGQQHVQFRNNMSPEEKQAIDTVEKASAKLADRLIPNSSYDDFNRLYDAMNNEILRLQDESRKAATNFKNTLEQVSATHANLTAEKDIRIKHLEVQLERTQKSLSAARKSLQANLLMNAVRKEEIADREQEEAQQRMPAQRRQIFQGQHQPQQWIMEDEMNPQDMMHEEEVEEEVVEELVDEEMFERLQQQAREQQEIDDQDQEEGVQEGEHEHLG